MASRDDNKVAYKLYVSKPWRRCREGYLKSKGYLCERCLSIGLYTPATEVHHKIRITAENINDPSITLNW